MTLKENRAASEADPRRYVKTLDIYGRVLSVILLLFGLGQWAVIIGVMPSAGGDFEAMSIAWKMATMYLAVLDLVAAVGLWMRVAWGDVLWVCAALSEIAFHTFFVNTFGSSLGIVVFHLFSMFGFVALIVLARKQREAWPFGHR